MANYLQFSSLGVANYMGAKVPGWFCNLGFSTATSADADDSLVITGADAALSATNPLHVTLPSTANPGQLLELTATSDVSLLLTGADWGLAANTNDVKLAVYAINDGGTLKWGVSKTSGLLTIASTSTSNLPADINLQTEMLIAGASGVVTNPSPCMLVGWIYGNFTHATDKWAVQKATGDLNVGASLNAPDSEVHVTVGNGHGSTNTKIRKFTTTIKNVGSDITYASAADVGASFTINTDGLYTMSYADYLSTSASQHGFSLNSAELTTAILSITAATRLAHTDAYNNMTTVVTRTARLKAGDVIRPHTSGNQNATTAVWFSITKIGD